MAEYTPKEYAEQVHYGKVQPQTVRKWIRDGLLPPGTRVEYTPSNRAIIIVEEKQSKVDDLIAQMEAKYNGAKAA